MITDNDIKEKAYKYSVERNPRFTKSLSVTVSNMLEEAYYQGYRAAIADVSPSIPDISPSTREAILDVLTNRVRPMIAMASYWEEVPVALEKIINDYQHS